MTYVELSPIYDLKRRSDNTCRGFMKMRELTSGVSESTRNCQRLSWEGYSVIRKKKWDVGFFFLIGKHAIVARYCSRDRWHGRCCERKMTYY
jgi:hypothetical protein